MTLPCVFVIAYPLRNPLNSREKVHATTLDTEQLGGHRALNLPGVSCTVAEQIDALRAIAGQDAVNLITPRPDPDIAAIIARRPEAFAATCAKALGFVAETRFADIIPTYIDDDMTA